MGQVGDPGPSNHKVSLPQKGEKKVLVEIRTLKMLLLGNLRTRESSFKRETRQGLGSEQRLPLVQPTMWVTGPVHSAARPCPKDWIRSLMSCALTVPDTEV